MRTGVSSSAIWGLVGAVSAGAASILMLFAWTPSSSQKASESLETRYAQFRLTALLPGSAMGCLEPDLGAAIVEACEMALFDSAGTLGAAQTHVADGLAILAEALKLGAPRSPGVEVAVRRTQNAFEQDRFGLVAYVLNMERGCSHHSCEAFSLFRNTDRLRENLKSNTFEMILARHYPKPDKPELDSAASSAMSPITTVSVSRGKPLPPQYTLPSSASIPPVSIMVEEATTSDQKAQAEPSRRPSQAEPSQRPSEVSRAKPGRPAAPTRAAESRSAGKPLSLSPFANP